jgi:hypothetical protein
VGLPDADAPLECECLRETPTGDQVIETRAELSRTCEESLLATCPALLPLTQDDRDSACAFYAACDPGPLGFSEPECLEDPPDACVACTVDELRRQPAAAGCAQNVFCRDACSDLVPRETAIAACEQLAEDLGALDGLDGAPHAAICLCSTCHPAFADCMIDPGCLAGLECAASVGCVGDACWQDPTCGPLIMSLSSASVSRLLTFSECAPRRECYEGASP